MSEDPLGDLERELVAAARRRAQGPTVARRAQATLAVASAGFALILVLAVMLLLAGR